MEFVFHVSKVGERMRVKEGRRRGEDREGRGGGRREKEGREAFKMLDIISVNFFL